MKIDKKRAVTFNQFKIPVKTLSTVISGTRSPSAETPSITKLSALADTLNADNRGCISTLVKSWVTVTTRISLSWLKRLKQQFAKVKLNL